MDREGLLPDSSLQTTVIFCPSSTHIAQGQQQEYRDPEPHLFPAQTNQIEKRGVEYGGGEFFRFSSAEWQNSELVFHGFQ